MTFLGTLYVFLPAFLANAAPVLLMHVPFLRRHNAPLWESQLGANKTWRGLIGGTVAGMLTALAQFGIRDWSVVAGWGLPFAHQGVLQAMLVGALLGGGALIGDAVKSFFKRRMGIRPGSPLPFLDGIDHTLGAMLFLFPIFLPSFWNAVLLILISPALSLAANTFSYFVGWKKTWH